jgi:hypothetical protein
LPEVLALQGKPGRLKGLRGQYLFLFLTGKKKKTSNTEIKGFLAQHSYYNFTLFTILQNRDSNYKEMFPFSFV